MSYRIKFPIRIKIEDVKRFCEIPEEETVSVFRMGTFGVIRVETWDRLLEIHRNVSLGLRSLLSYEIRDEKTGERVDADVIAVQWGRTPRDWYPKFARRKLRKRRENGVKNKKAKRSV